MKKLLLIGILFLTVLVALAGCGSSSSNSNNNNNIWPSSWQHQDIGTGMLAGSASYQNGTFTITGAGNPTPLDSDRLHFVYQTINGDFTIIARVASMQKKDPSASAGLMVRNTLVPNSQMIQFFVSPPTGYFGSRKTVGATSSCGAEGVTPIPLYLKLVRNGNEFSGFYSTDGQNWDPSGYNNPTFTFDPVAMNEQVYVGMFVYSYDLNILETDTFDNVAIIKQ